MRDLWQWLRSLVFVVQMYLAMVVVGLVWLPWMLVSKNGARHACKSYCRWVMWTVRWMCGITCEIRGEVPQGEVLVAAKHQSFLDVLMLFNAVPSGKFIMKKSLIYAPVLGMYGLRIGCIPVDRGKRSEAIQKMKRDVAAGVADPGQLLIYPQGTRVNPGVEAPYRVGPAVLYEQLGQPCVPVACNVGLFWPRTGIIRRPGHAVLEFLPPIAPGLTVPEVRARIEEAIEPASNRLMRDAGFEGGALGAD